MSMTSLNTSTASSRYLHGVPSHQWHSPHPPTAHHPHPAKAVAAKHDAGGIPLTPCRPRRPLQLANTAPILPARVQTTLPVPALHAAPSDEQCPRLPRRHEQTAPTVRLVHSTTQVASTTQVDVAVACSSVTHPGGFTCVRSQQHVSAYALWSGVICKSCGTVQLSNQLHTVHSALVLACITLASSCSVPVSASQPMICAPHPRTQR
mgnify:CR=1 FL=1